MYSEIGTCSSFQGKWC